MPELTGGRSKLQRRWNAWKIGNFSNAKAAGAGVSEYKIEFGPGILMRCGTTLRKTALMQPTGSVAEILQTCDGLALFPHQGHHRPKLTSQLLRLVVLRDFVLAYAPDELPVWVVAVLHGRRNPRVLAAMLRDRSPETS